MSDFRIGSLPDDALAAAASFHADFLPQLLDRLAGGETCLTVIFAPAAHAHRDWRRAAIATIAREKAPARINAIASDDETAIEAALRYLETADGVTGQYLPLDSHGAGQVLSSAS
jgi:hypothetical protein